MDLLEGLQGFDGFLGGFLFLDLDGLDLVLEILDPEGVLGGSLRGVPAGLRAGAAGLVGVDRLHLLGNARSSITARAGVDGGLDGLLLGPLLLVVHAGGDGVARLSVELTVVVGVVATRLGGGQSGSPSSEEARLAVASALEVELVGRDDVVLSIVLGLPAGFPHDEGVARFHHFACCFCLL